MLRLQPFLSNTVYRQLLETITGKPLLIDCLYMNQIDSLTRFCPSKDVHSTSPSDQHMSTIQSIHRPTAVAPVASVMMISTMLCTHAETAQTSIFAKDTRRSTQKTPVSGSVSGTSISKFGLNLMWFQMVP